FDTKFGTVAGRKRERIVRRTYGSPPRRANKVLDAKLKGDVELYRDYFRFRAPWHASFFGEISPSYALIGKDGFCEIRKLFPKIRILFLMRDPIDRYYS